MGHKPRKITITFLALNSDVDVRPLNIYAKNPRIVLNLCHCIFVYLPIVHFSSADVKYMLTAAKFWSESSTYSLYVSQRGSNGENVNRSVNSSLSEDPLASHTFSSSLPALAEAGAADNAAELSLGQVREFFNL